MKLLIKQGRRKFIHRKDRDYDRDLDDIGITEDEAWEVILSLGPRDFILDYRPIYRKIGEDALVFKRMIKKKRIYIKIKLEKRDNDDITVCLSFHIDNKRGVRI